MPRFVLVGLFIFLVHFPAFLEARLLPFGVLPEPCHRGLQAVRDVLIDEAIRQIFVKPIYRKVLRMESDFNSGRISEEETLDELEDVLDSLTMMIDETHPRIRGPLDMTIGETYKFLIVLGRPVHPRSAMNFLWMSSFVKEHQEVLISGSNGIHLHQHTVMTLERPIIQNAAKHLHGMITNPGFSDGRARKLDDPLIRRILEGLRHEPPPVGNIFVHEILSRLDRARLPGDGQILWNFPAESRRR